MGMNFCVLRAYTNLHISVHMCAYFTCTYMFIDNFVDIKQCFYMWVHVRMWECVCVCASVYVCACVSLCACI